jgi:hypothetical protein
MHDVLLTAAALCRSGCTPAVDVQDPVVPLRNEVLGCLASAVDVIGPHDIYRATGNPSRDYDSRKLSAERDQVPRTHRRADHDDGLTPVGEQIVDGPSLAARRYRASHT